MSSFLLTGHYWEGLTVFFTPTPRYLRIIISDNKLSQFLLTSHMLQDLNHVPDPLLDSLCYIQVSLVLRIQSLHPAVHMWPQWGSGGRSRREGWSYLASWWCFDKCSLEYSWPPLLKLWSTCSTYNILLCIQSKITSYGVLGLFWVCLFFWGGGLYFTEVGIFRKLNISFA